MEEMELFPQATRFEDVRRVMVAALRDTAEIIPDTSETHFLARFHIQNDTIDRKLVAACVVTKSTGLNLPHVLLVRGLMSEDAALQIMHKGRGLKPLKHDDTMQKVGVLAACVRSDAETLRPLDDPDDDEKSWRRAVRLANERAPHLSAEQRRLLASLINEKEWVYGRINLLPLDAPTRFAYLTKLKALKWAIEQCTNSERNRMR
jgi:hypothetical protein